MRLLISFIALMMGACATPVPHEQLIPLPAGTLDGSRAAIVVVQPEREPAYRRDVANVSVGYGLTQDRIVADYVLVAAAPFSQLGYRSDGETLARHPFEDAVRAHFVEPVAALLEAAGADVHDGSELRVIARDDYPSRRQRYDRSIDVRQVGLDPADGYARHILERQLALDALQSELDVDYLLVLNTLRLGADLVFGPFFIPSSPPYGVAAFSAYLRSNDTEEPLLNIHRQRLAEVPRSPRGGRSADDLIPVVEQTLQHALGDLTQALATVLGKPLATP